MIIKNGFEFRKGKATNDLGNGVYTYCDDEKGAWNPRLNAMKFAKQFRNGPVCVLRVVIDDDEIKNNFLNLDHPEITPQWETVRKSLEYKAQKRWSSFPPGKAKKRHNIDGIILEYVFNDTKILTDENIIVNDPCCVLKQTYTSFIPRTISNFPNGRELVIRDLNIIKSIEIQEVE